MYFFTNSTFLPGLAVFQVLRAACGKWLGPRQRWEPAPNLTRLPAAEASGLHEAGAGRP